MLAFETFCGLTQWPPGERQSSVVSPSSGYMPEVS